MMEVLLLTHCLCCYDSLSFLSVKARSHCFGHKGAVCSTLPKTTADKSVKINGSLVTVTSC